MEFGEFISYDDLISHIDSYNTYSSIWSIGKHYKRSKIIDYKIESPTNIKVLIEYDKSHQKKWKSFHSDDIKEILNKDYNYNSVYGDSLNIEFQEDGVMLSNDNPYYDTLLTNE
jgi:hypothetical protein